MAIKYLKKSPKTTSTDDLKTREIVQNLLNDLEKSREDGCKELTKKFDKYDGEIIVSKEKIEEIKKTLDQKTKDDIKFSYDRVRKFAKAQLKNYGQDFELELSKGLYAGQKLIPVNTAGCYVPGGRYAHIASAVMSVTTAKVAGVKNIIACSPPKEGVGAHPAIVYVLTENGIISNQIFGINPTSNDLKLAILNAHQDSISSIFDKILLYCYKYDPKAGNYTLLASNVMKVAGASTVFIMGLFLSLFWIKEKLV